MISDLSRDEGDYILHLEEELSNNNLLLIFYPHPEFKMKLNFKDTQQTCAAYLAWTSQSAKMGDLLFPRPCTMEPSYWMLQFKIFASASAVIIHCEDTQNFVFVLTTPQICGGGVGVKALTDIRFSADYGHQLYTVGAIKYGTQALPSTLP